MFESTAISLDLKELECLVYLTRKHRVYVANMIELELGSSDKVREESTKMLLEAKSLHLRIKGKYQELRANVSARQAREMSESTKRQAIFEIEAKMGKCLDYDEPREIEEEGREYNPDDKVDHWSK